MQRRNAMFSIRRFYANYSNFGANLHCTHFGGKRKWALNADYYVVNCWESLVWTNLHEQE
jgi:hypothetical protein